MTMIKARMRGLGAADPFTRGFDLFGQQLSPAQLQALRLAPQHASRVSSNPSTQVEDSDCAQILASVDYFGAPPEQHAQLLALCREQGVETFMTSAQAAGFDTSAAKPWYKRPSTLIVVGAVALGGVLLWRLL